MYYSPTVLHSTVLLLNIHRILLYFAIVSNSGVRCQTQATTCVNKIANIAANTTNKVQSVHNWKKNKNQLRQTQLKLKKRSRQTNDCVNPAPRNNYAKPGKNQAICAKLKSADWFCFAKTRLVLSRAGPWVCQLIQEGAPVGCSCEEAMVVQGDNGKANISIINLDKSPQDAGENYLKMLQTLDRSRSESSRL